MIIFHVRVSQINQIPGSWFTCAIHYRDVQQNKDVVSWCRCRSPMTGRTDDEVTMFVRLRLSSKSIGWNDDGRVWHATTVPAPGVTGGKYADDKSRAHAIVNVRVKFKQLVEWQLMNLKTSRSESFLESLTDVTDVPSLVEVVTSCKDCNVYHHETSQIQRLVKTPDEHFFTRVVKNRKENCISFQPLLENVI